MQSPSSSRSIAGDGGIRSPKPNSVFPLSPSSSRHGGDLTLVSARSSTVPDPLNGLGEERSHRKLRISTVIEVESGEPRSPAKGISKKASWDMQPPSGFEPERPGALQLSGLANQLANKAADSSNRSNRQLHITTNLAFSEEPLPLPLALPDPGSPAKGGDLSARGGKQMSRIAAQLASKSMRFPPGGKGGVLAGSDSDDDGLGAGGWGRSGPWGALDAAGTSVWGRASARLSRKWDQLYILPTSQWYQRFFYLCVLAALVSGWVLPFHAAFMGGLFSPFRNGSSITELVCNAVFATDFVLKFFVAFNDPDDGSLVTAKSRIARRYVASWQFVLDVLGWLPYDIIAIEVANAQGAGRGVVTGLAWLQLLHLVRMYRVFELFALVDHRMVISQGALLVLRNYTYVIYATHWAACILYHIAAQEQYSPQSWVGRNAVRFQGKPLFHKYVQALYFSVSAFQGFGDGSLYVSTVPEMSFLILYLLFNLFLGAYILGTVTMLVVKGDEQSKAFRERVNQLNDFSKDNDLPQRLQTAMKHHLEVTFHSEQVSDEHVLGIYPTTIRRKVLRHLYLQPVKSCYLFKGCKQRFLDAILSAARVELFMPGVQILTQGDNVTELLIVVVGEVMVAEAGIDLHAAFGQYAAGKGDSSTRGSSREPSMSMGGGRSINGRSMSNSMRGAGSMRDLGSMRSTGSMADNSQRGGMGALTFMALAAAGKSVVTRSSSDPLAEVPYFADVPSNESVMSQTIVRALSLPKAAWDKLQEQYPQQARLVLANLQSNAEAELSRELQEVSDTSDVSAEDLRQALALMKAKSSSKKEPELLVRIRDQVQQSDLDHLSRLDNVRTVVRSTVRKVDQARTFEFLNHASSGSVEALRAMLGQGVAPHCADYDGRTGLMLTAVGGHEAAARLLLDSGAKSDQLDAFGNTAMAEAVKNSHDNIIDLLLSYGGTLAMDPMAVAGIMCTAVFEGDLVKLRRLLRSGAPPDACDYDRRCALHIAGAEGNLAAVKLLVEEGRADAGFQDRWGNTALDEARRVGAAPVVAYLEGLLQQGAEREAAGSKQREQVATEFLNACAAGEADRVGFIVAHAQPSCLFTGLLLAASKGHKEVVEQLLSWLTPDALSTDGHVLLAEAARMGHVAAVHVLRAWGSRLADPRDGGLAAQLRAAVVGGNARGVAALIAAGVDVNANGGSNGNGSASARSSGVAAAAGGAGSTLLHVAAAQGNLEVVRRLVEEGCLAPSVTDGSGRTPLAVAEHARHGPLVEYLRWASSYVSTSTQGPYAQLGEAAKARFGALPDLTVAAAAAAGEEKDKDGVAKGALAAGRGTRGSSTSGDGADYSFKPMLLAQMPGYGAQAAGAAAAAAAGAGARGATPLGGQRGGGDGAPSSRPGSASGHGPGGLLPRPASGGLRELLRQGSNLSSFVRNVDYNELLNQQRPPSSQGQVRLLSRNSSLNGSASATRAGGAGGTSSTQLPVLHEEQDKDLSVHSTAHQSGGAPAAAPGPAVTHPPAAAQSAGQSASRAGTVTGAPTLTGANPRTTFQPMPSSAAASQPPSTPTRRSTTSPDSSLQHLAPPMPSLPGSGAGTRPGSKQQRLLGSSVTNTLVDTSDTFEDFMAGLSDPPYSPVLRMPPDARLGLFPGPAPASRGEMAPEPTHGSSEDGEQQELRHMDTAALMEHALEALSPGAKK